MAMQFWESMLKLAILYLSVQIVIGMHFLPLPCYASSPPIPREIIVLYDSRVEPTPQNTLAHLMIEHSLNYLGLVTHYHDISLGLPLNRETDFKVRGFLTCFPRGLTIAKPDEYAAWLLRAIKNGKRIVIVGDPGLNLNSKGSTRELLARLGLQEISEILYVPDLTLSEGDPANFIREFLPRANFSFLLAGKPTKGTESLLSVLGADKSNEMRSLITSTLHGGFISPEVAFIRTFETRELRWWYLDPIKYFAKVYATEDLLVPDLNTAYGSRVQLALIDGSDWREGTEDPEFRQMEMGAARVIKHRILQSFPQLQFSLGLPGAFLDPSLQGTQESRNIAKEILSLANLEFIFDSYSDVWSWGFLQEFSAEETNLNAGSEVSEEAKASLQGWSRARQFSEAPFSLESEFNKPASLLSSLLPNLPRPKTLIWSGNRLPSSSALAYAHSQKLLMIGAGSSRMDPRFNSQAWLTPLRKEFSSGESVVYLPLAEEAQFFAQANNFAAGFSEIQASLDNTENPRRLAPISIAFSLRSAQTLARTNNVVRLLGRIAAMEVFPTTLSDYAAQVYEFDSLEQRSCGSLCWTLAGPLNISTFRIEESTLVPDFSKSIGLLGYRVFQGSLFLSIDRNAPLIKIQLAARSDSHQPYLISSNWALVNFSRQTHELRFQAKGLDKLRLKVSVPWDSDCVLKFFGKEHSASIESAKAIKTNGSCEFLQVIPPPGTEWMSISDGGSQ